MQKTISKPVVKNRAQKERKAPRLSFRHIVAAARALPVDQKIDLFDTLSAETREARRERFIAEVKESEAEYARGEYVEGTAEEVLRELKR